MNNDEVSVRDIFAKEGLGSFAFELETLHPNLESASLTSLLATVIRETKRLPDWWDPNSEQASAARECHRQTMEAIEGLAVNEDHKYRHLLIIGYLYGRLTLPSREVLHELSQAEREMQKNKNRDERRKAGFKEVEADREEGRLWMRGRATEIWKEDQAKELSLGKMAARVADLIKQESAVREARRDESTRHWPRSLDKIKDAIRPAAPEYALKKGRPRKK